MKKLFFLLTFPLLLIASSKDLEADMRSGEMYEEALKLDEELLSNRADVLKNLQRKIDKATDNLIKASVGELRSRGHNDLAISIEGEWRGRYKGFIYSFTPGSRDVGDHEAILWLLKIHDSIHFVLGEKICKAIRTHDLWVIAYTVKVVFSCVDNVDINEYSKHFIPLLGIVSYWTSYGVCVGVTMGIGAMSFACGLVGMGVEEIVKRFIAPAFCHSAWKRACS